MGRRILSRTSRIGDQLQKELASFDPFEVQRIFAWIGYCNEVRCCKRFRLSGPFYTKPLGKMTAKHFWPENQLHSRKRLLRVVATEVKLRVMPALTFHYDPSVSIGSRSLLS